MSTPQSQKSVLELCREQFNLHGEYWYLPDEQLATDDAPAHLLLENVVP